MAACQWWHKVPRELQIKNELPGIDEFIAISAPEVDENCKLSFVTHYIGTALLHHKEVAKVYEQDKNQYLKNEQMSKNFQYTLLNSSMLIKSLIEFNYIYKINSGSDFFLEDQIPKLIMELQSDKNLRRLLKKMNSLNDYFLLRKMYDCIDKTKISFGLFIKLSNKEIIDLIKEKYSIFKIDSAKVLYSNVFNDSNDTNVQIIKNENQGRYRYGNFKGYIDTEIFNDEKDIKEFILSLNVNPLVKVIYDITCKREFDSAKKFYTQMDDSDTYLIEDTLRLISGLPDVRNADLQVEKRECAAGAQAGGLSWK